MQFEIGGDDFYTDLLFFPVEQPRYRVIELTTGNSQPEGAGKLNLRLALIDRLTAVFDQIGSDDDEEEFRQQ